MDMSIELNGLKWSVDDTLAIHIQAYAMVTGLTVAQVVERMAYHFLSRRGPAVQQLVRSAVEAYAEEQEAMVAEVKYAVFLGTPGGYLIQHEPTTTEASALVAFTSKLSPIGHDDDWRRWPPIFLATYTLSGLSSAGLLVSSWKRLRIESDQYSVGADEGEQIIKVDMFTPLS